MYTLWQPALILSRKNFLEECICLPLEVCIVPVNVFHEWSSIPVPTDCACTSIVLDGVLA